MVFRGGLIVLGHHRRHSLHLEVFKKCFVYVERSPEQAQHQHCLPSKGKTGCTSMANVPGNLAMNIESFLLLLILAVVARLLLLAEDVLFV